MGWLLQSRNKYRWNSNMYPYHLPYRPYSLQSGVWSFFGKFLPPSFHPQSSFAPLVAFELLLLPPRSFAFLPLCVAFLRRFRPNGLHAGRQVHHHPLLRPRHLQPWENERLGVAVPVVCLVPPARDTSNHHYCHHHHHPRHDFDDFAVMWEPRLLRDWHCRLERPVRQIFLLPASWKQIERTTHLVDPTAIDERYEQLHLLRHHRRRNCPNNPHVLAGHSWIVLRCRRPLIFDVATRLERIDSVVDSTNPIVVWVCHQPKTEFWHPLDWPPDDREHRNNQSHWRTRVKPRPGSSSSYCCLHHRHSHSPERRHPPPDLDCDDVDEKSDWNDWARRNRPISPPPMRHNPYRPHPHSRATIWPCSFSKRPTDHRWWNHFGEIFAAPLPHREERRRPK
mmetsp:Transcript_18679/g.38621  ORF Transcript_18679/g.38621 Transcript_18679/m.38621 type:complete len:394 (+) Transcript_18679:2377-3558(+)